MPNKLQSPGAFLTHLLNKYRLSVAEFAENIGISPSMARQLTQDKAKISTSAALRLAKYFNTVPEYWLVQQMRYDIAEAGKDKELAKEIRSISKVKKPSEKKLARAKAEKKDEKKKVAPAKKKAAKGKAVKKTAKKKETLADKRRKAGKIPGAKPAARSKGTKKKSR